MLDFESENGGENEPTSIIISVNCEDFDERYVTYKIGKIIGRPLRRKIDRKWCLVMIRAPTKVDVDAYRPVIHQLNFRRS